MLLIGLALAGLSFSASGTCSLPADTSFVENFSELPKEIQKRILADGTVAERGGKFSPNDNITAPALPTRRFVTAGRKGQTWFVQIEDGGFGGPHIDVYGYWLVKDTRTQRVDSMEVATLAGPPCDAARAILLGVHNFFHSR